MRILLCGGGTAGHVYPAIAMMEIIRTKYPDAEFLFIGRDGGSENDIPRSEGIPVEVIDAKGIDRKNIFKALGGLFKALTATRKAKRIIKEFAPNLVIGTGGYATWPVITAAKSMKIKTIIHESNAYPGLVTRMLAPRCDATILGFTSAEEHLKHAKRVLFLGNPTRHEFKALSREEARRRLGIPKSSFLVVSFGGSLGAGVMNEVIPETMLNLSKRYPTYTHIHACGRRFYDECARKHPELIKKHGTRIVPYIENVPIWFSAADLAITRSGAITIAELTAARVPSILIPSPNVTDDHQSANARAMSASGGAILLPEGELTVSSLSGIMETILSDKARTALMRSKIPKDCTAEFEKRFTELFDELYPF